LSGGADSSTFERNLVMLRRPPILTLLLLAALAGCKHYPYTWVQELPIEAESPAIQPGDTLAVTVRNQAQMSGEFLVRANGAYAQPVVGEIRVQGMTCDEISRRLTDALGGIVQNPVVTVSVATVRQLRISVLGEVHTQGTVQVPYGEGVLGAIARAGGLTEYADPDAIFVLREKPKRMRIRFTFTNLTRGDEHSDAFKLRDGDLVIVE
jgi:polysaccharide export outer membrane protein